MDVEDLKFTFHVHANNTRSPNGDRICENPLINMLYGHKLKTCHISGDKKLYAPICLDVWFFSQCSKQIVAFIVLTSSNLSPTGVTETNKLVRQM